MITLAEIRKAAEFLEGEVLHTPLIPSPRLSGLTGADVYLKLENLQRTGSFKIRGAKNAIRSRRKDIGPGGVVASSAGNHAQGVALAARDAGVPATIVMPASASLSKQEATREYGARVILSRECLAECIEQAGRMAAEEEMVFIHPYDDPDVIAGQGTIGTEILLDMPDPGTIVLPIGGGGLIAGVAVAVKGMRPGTRIVGVEASACPSAYSACRAGALVCIDPGHSVADGITVKQVGALTYPVIREHVDEIVLVDEEQIAEAMVYLLEQEKVLAEGAGAVPVAALLSGAITPEPGEKVVLVVTGGNVDPLILDRVLRHGFLRRGRIMRFSVWLPDEPGALAGLLSSLNRLQANILQIHHDRLGRGLPIFMSRVDLEAETRGHEHIREIENDLTGAGYRIRVR
jgi:threonine dehydratase